MALNRLATVTLRQQGYAEAKALYLQSLELYRELDDKGGLASTLNGLAFVASGQADYGTATQDFRRALQIVEELHFAPLAMWILLGIGEMLLKTRRMRRGVELLALVVHHPASEREARFRSQRRLERVRDRLPPEEYAASYQRGQQADLDQTLAQLLTDLLGWQASSPVATSQHA
jgi:tetratricopeptide (TPR) repeat protein